MSSRTRTKILLLSALSLTFSSCKTTDGGSKSASSQHGGGFVKTKGTQFTLDGKPFYFQGTNFYRVAMHKQFTPAELDDIFAQYKNNGITVVRLWGFSCETPDEWKSYGITPGFHSHNGAKPMLDRNGNYNNEALEQLDRALAAAGNRGIKIILPLVNYEPEYCGMEWWNHVHGTKGESKQAFYCNDNVIRAYRKHMETILNRSNSVNGRKYKDDPTIMAIELANEPHTKDGYETSGKIDKSCQSKVNGKPGDLVYNWLRDTSQFVKSIDRNHLVTTGEEGYKSSGDTSKHAWLHNGLKGVGFEKNVSIPSIDFSTVHLYPDNSEIPKSDFDSWYVDKVIKDRAYLAHGAGKPIVLEETGFSEYREGPAYMEKYKRMDYHGDRPNWLRKMYEAANQVDYAGTMVWQVVPMRSNGQPYDDDDFTFGMNSAEGKVVLEQARYMQSKNR